MYKSKSYTISKEISIYYKLIFLIIASHEKYFCFSSNIYLSFVASIFSKVTF